jgi:peptidyl-prolyl cis-trans isomerase SurA
MEVSHRINIPDQEVEQMIKLIHKQGDKTTKFHFVHIMLKKSKDNSPAAAKKIADKANLIVKKIKAGDNINALAIKYSQGPKASKGGDWGWRTINDIPSFIVGAFNDIKTKKGDIIGPFKSKIGTHIIKIIGKKGSNSVMTLEVKARHILIKPSIILSDDKAIALLNKYRQQIIDGKKTFAKLAEEHSQDPASAVKGGNLGWSDPTIFVPAFKEKATTLAIGKISRPFKTIDGWHILEILARRKADTTQEAIKRRAYNILFKQRFPIEVYAWLNEIRQQAYIKITNPNYIIKTEE